MSAKNSGGQATLARMAQIASIGRPCNITVVTGPTKPPFDNIRHLEVVAAYSHLETELGVANLAPEAYPMEPVRENHRPHSLFFRAPIQHYVCILRHRRRYVQTEQRQHHKQAKRQISLHLGGTAPAGMAIGSDGLGAWPGRATL